MCTKATFVQSVAAPVLQKAPIVACARNAVFAMHTARSKADPACQAAFRYAEETRCVVNYERSFFRPVFE